MPAHNMRFGAMAAEARNNGSANLKVPCAAERLVEAATAPSRHHVSRKRAKVRWTTYSEFDSFALRESITETDKPKTVQVDTNRKRQTVSNLYVNKF